MSHRNLRRLLATGLVALGGLIGGASRASAHADLVSTTPEYGASLVAGPDRVLLRFNYPVEMGGADVRLERSGTRLETGTPVHAAPDHKAVSVPLLELGEGGYVLTWFLFAQDGHIMTGELPFEVLPPAAAADAPRPVVPGPPVEGDPASWGQRPFSRLSAAQSVARLLGFVSLAVLVGGVAFVALLWPAGAELRRTRLLLWASLAGALGASAADVGLKGAAILDRSALAAASPSALTALSGSHFTGVLVARVGFLVLAAGVVLYLTVAPGRARRSRLWLAGAGSSGLGLGATHALLGTAPGADGSTSGAPGLCLPGDVTVVHPVALRPFVIAVTAELCIAATILAATAVLVGRSPPT